MSEDVMSRFSNNSRQTLMIASSLAETYNHRHIEPIHILIALANESEGVGSRILRKYGIREQELINSINDYGLELNIGAIRPRLSPRSLNLLQIAINESVATKSKLISSGHLLIAITKIEDNRVNQIFVDSDVKIESMQDDIYKQLRRE